MQKLLVDAGPLIALFDKNDQHHTRVLNHIKTVSECMISTWTVITEVSQMLDFNVKAQLGFLKWIDVGGLEIYPIDKYDISRIIELTEKYADVPMDLADASLVVVSEHIKSTRILSIDSDFQIFRNRFKDYLVNELV